MIFSLQALIHKSFKQHRKKGQIFILANKSSSYDDDDDITEEKSSLRRNSTKTNSIISKIKVTSDELPITIVDDDNVNNNFMELSDNSSTKEIVIDESANVNLLLHLTPNSSSSISLIFNETEDITAHNDNTTTNNDTTFTAGNKSIDGNLPEVIDETDQVEQIETVRNSKDGISFRIKLFNQNEPEWISSKIANLKYPQAVIAFWETHVEFT